MRPSNVDTSEPACTKRKMLSTNSSTSWFCTSRKYSAIVSADRATRSRTPGGSSICPKTSAAFSNTPDSSISIRRSVPSRVRSPTPANTDTPPCLEATRLIISVINTVLPTPAPPNRPILPPERYGVSRSMTLMPVVNMRRRRLERVEQWRVAVDVPALHVGVVGRVVVEAVAPHVPHMTQRAVANRHLDAVAEVANRRAAGEAVGRLHADGPHAAVAELLGDLGQHDDRLAVDLHGELERGVELGQRAARELDVDHGAGDADNASVGEFCFRSCG